MAAWSASTYYQRGAVVTQAGADYRAAESVVGVVPPANPWVPVAESGSVTSGDVDAIDVLTQAAYDALDPPVATTLYVIVG